MKRIALVCFALFIVSGLLVVAQQSASEVTVLVSATDKYGRVIANLKKEDIQLFEDGKRQLITKFEKADDLPISMEVLIDTSASVKKQSVAVPGVAKWFLNLTIRKGKDTATITSFGKSVKFVQSATDDVIELVSAIDKITMQPFIGSTPLVSTVADSATHLATAPGRRMILLISDGMDNNSNMKWSKMIAILQKNNVAVYPMYCFCQEKLPGEPPRFTLDTWGEMRSLAEQTGGTDYLPAVVSAQAIDRDLRQIARELASQRVFSFQTSSPADSTSLRKIRIEPATPELKGLKFKHRRRY